MLMVNDDFKYLLEKIELAILPMANIDGFLKNDRYAANGLDLNRDHTKLMAPETKLQKKNLQILTPISHLIFMSIGHFVRILLS